VVVELYISSIYQFSQSTTLLLQRIDFGICLIFLSEFFYNLYKSESKKKFLIGHWIDFISSIPFVGVLRIGRFVRIIRIFRLIRSGKMFVEYINKNKSYSTLQMVLIFTGLLIILSSISVFIIENPVNPEFGSLLDSFWWSVITLSTVGYGDVVPITPEGKLFSVLLIGMGIVLIGTLTGFLTDYFVGDEEIKERLVRIEEKLDKLLEDK
jgi:voltage-gated potassium channel